MKSGLNTLLCLCYYPVLMFLVNSVFLKWVNLCSQTQQTNSTFEHIKVTVFHWRALCVFDSTFDCMLSGKENSSKLFYAVLKFRQLNLYELWVLNLLAGSPPSGLAAQPNSIFPVPASLPSSFRISSDLQAQPADLFVTQWYQ